MSMWRFCDKKNVANRKNYGRKKMIIFPVKKKKKKC